MYDLRMCVWEITLACCFSCKYCGSSGGKAREDELSTIECLNTADQLHELGCRRVSMIGGEVFMRRDWKEIVTRLTGHGIRVNIITNGFIFREELIRDLKDARIESVSVSIDGPKAVHDKYRQEGSYDRAIAALESLLSAGIPVSVISTLNSENVTFLEEMYSILRKYSIYAWQLQACSPMGNAANNRIDFAFDMAGVIDFVISHMYEAPFAMGVADNIGYFTKAEGTIRGNLSGDAYFRGCSAGITSIGIDSVGNVRGCESMYDERFNEGNLRRESLRTIWEDPERFAYNRKFDRSLLTGKCAECELGEYCGGGCRSYNYFVHKKLYESPFCAGGAKKG
ncbi:MAG: radical SAM protein [Lachnospiraceae bacterium]|nr:radical SAM protein [Lachnospiraceae bacterium]